MTERIKHELQLLHEKFVVSWSLLYWMYMEQSEGLQRTFSARVFASIVSPLFEYISVMIRTHSAELMITSKTCKANIKRCHLARMSD